MRPFSGSDSHSYLTLVMSRIRDEIEEYDNDKFLRSSKTEIETYFFDKAYIDPIVLNDQYFISNKSGIVIDARDSFIRSSLYNKTIKVAGTRLVISMSYTGDRKLWEIRPSVFSLSGYPDLTTTDSEVSFSISFADANANTDQIKREIESNVKSLAEASASLRHDIDSYNSHAIKQIKTLLEQKHNKAINATNTIEQLGIPIKRSDKPPLYSVPTVRRKSPASHLPKPALDNFKAEPELDSEEYEYILRIINSMSLVIERSPLSFANLNEEAIRTFFLLQLNGHYEGSATGETFNASGKTDILIRVDNKNVFIAECKFWRGEASFNKAIDQILGYLSWRDSKCALIIFNKSKNTSSVKNKMNEIITGRKEFRKTVYADKEGISQYILVKDTDPGKEITLSSLLFDFPDT